MSTCVGARDQQCALWARLGPRGNRGGGRLGFVRRHMLKSMIAYIARTCRAWVRKLARCGARLVITAIQTTRVTINIGACRVAQASGCGSRTAILPKWPIGLTLHNSTHCMRPHRNISQGAQRVADRRAYHHTRIACHMCTQMPVVRNHTRRADRGCPCNPQGVDQRAP